MSGIFGYTPAPPEWRLRWQEMDCAYPFIRAMAGCPQDPIYHAEGGVWIHTRMVCEELAAMPAWRALPTEQREVLFAAAVLHDVAKPQCTRTDEEGRITSRGHSRRGAIFSREILWRMHVPFDRREQICALIRFHQIPYFLIDRPDSQRVAIEVSQSARCDLLALLAEADVRGRVCADRQRLLDNVALFAEHVSELGCLRSPFVFASDHARVLFFLDERRIPEDAAYADHSCEVCMVCGLPGSGKDHFIRTALPGSPVIALDEVRDQLGIDPGDGQGAVIDEARERARAFLRRGESFVWNATNISRQLRRMSLELFAAYRARLRIVYLEAPPEILAAQMRKRDRVVPEKAMRRMLERWEVPDLTEAHAVEFQVRTTKT